MITAEIIQDIKSQAQAIDEIQEVFMHPEGADIVEVVAGVPVYKGSRVKQFPALVFLKDTINSEFNDSGSNRRTVSFKAWVLVPCENKENLDIWERILPNAVDAVIEKFDKTWNIGTTDDGFRVWCRVSSGMQGYTPEAEGRIAWEELSLIVQYSVPTS